MATASFREPTERSSQPVKKFSSLRNARRLKIPIDKDVEETPLRELPSPTAVPVTPVRRFLNLFDQYTQTDQLIKQYKHRQSQLDLAVQKLIEVLMIKSNENIARISLYWIYLRQVSLDRFPSHTNPFQILNCLFPTCCSTIESQKQLESYFKEHDEIQAALQVLSTTILIVSQQHSLATIHQLFDREEQTTVRLLRRHLESLLSSYRDELSFITERIHIYEARFATWKNSNTLELESLAYEWTHIVEHDYPSLIEKISNDFLSKISPIEDVLLQMLKNMRKRLLSINSNAGSKRTSLC